MKGTMKTETAFQLGRIFVTPGVMEHISPEEGQDALRRHSTGDWGDLGEEDKATNNQAVVIGTRIFSAYHTKAGEKFYIITEWDRSVTTFLLPSEY